MASGFTGGITIVTEYVRETQRRSREVFVPLSHPPGHAQVDFGEAVGVIGGVECKLHYSAMALPHSDAFFIKTYPAETTEAFRDGRTAVLGAEFGSGGAQLIRRHGDVRYRRLRSPQGRRGGRVLAGRFQGNVPAGAV